MSHKANPYRQCACAGSQSFSRGCAILRLERELAKVATAGPQARPGWDTRKASSIRRVMCRVFLRLDAQTAGALWWPWIHCFEEVEFSPFRSDSRR